LSIIQKQSTIQNYYNSNTVRNREVGETSRYQGQQAIDRANYQQIYSIDYRSIQDIQIQGYRTLGSIPRRLQGLDNRDFQGSQQGYYKNYSGLPKGI
jgi:hypothetical protein